MGVRGGLAALARRPSGLLQETGWLFWLCAVLSLLLTAAAAAAAAATSWSALATVLAAGVLAASWGRRYLRGATSALLDVVDVAAVTVFAAACSTPTMVFIFTSAVLWPRALYGTTRGAVGYSLGLGAAMATSVPLWSLVPGHVGSTPAGPVLGALPVLPLTALVARHLALVLLARDHAQRRDAALVELGTALLGVTQHTQARELAWQAAAALCAATPRLRVLVVKPSDGALRVRGAAGPCEAVPDVLRADVLPVRAPATGEAVALPAASELTAAVGADVSWLALGMPGDADATMLVGAPGGVCEDVLVALRSMMNQVALALRASDAHRDLAVQASTDALTGLANRAAFSAALGRCTGSPALLFVDLDDFKAVNDVHGHAAGDEVLRRVADRMRDAVRPDDLCARLGGDEFAVLLLGGDLDAAVAVAVRLVELVAAPVVLSGRALRVGASVGVVGPDPGSRLAAEQLLEWADVAMYAAKAGGKNRVQVFDATLLRVDGPASSSA